MPLNILQFELHVIYFWWKKIAKLMGYNQHFFKYFQQEPFQKTIITIRNILLCYRCMSVNFLLTLFCLIFSSQLFHRLWDSSSCSILKKRYYNQIGHLEWTAPLLIILIRYRHDILWFFLLKTKCSKKCSFKTDWLKEEFGVDPCRPWW